MPGSERNSDHLWNPKDDTNTVVSVAEQTGATNQQPVPKFEFKVINQMPSNEAPVQPRKSRSFRRGIGWVASGVLVVGGLAMINKRDAIVSYIDEERAKSAADPNNSGGTSTSGEVTNVEVTDGEGLSGSGATITDFCTPSTFQYKSEQYQACFDAESFEEIDDVVTALPRFEPIGYDESSDGEVVNLSRAFELISDRAGVDVCLNEMTRYREYIIDNRDNFGPDLDVDIPTVPTDIVIYSKVPGEPTETTNVVC